MWHWGQRREHSYWQEMTAVHAHVWDLHSAWWVYESWDQKKKFWLILQSCGVWVTLHDSCSPYLQPLNSSLEEHEEGWVGINHWLSLQNSFGFQQPLMCVRPIQCKERQHHGVVPQEGQPERQNMKPTSARAPVFLEFTCMCCTHDTL